MRACANVDFRAPGILGVTIRLLVWTVVGFALAIRFFRFDRFWRDRQASSLGKLLS